MFPSSSRGLAAVALTAALALTSSGAQAGTAGQHDWRVVKRIAVPGRSVQLFSIDADSRDDAWAAGVTTKDNGDGQRPLIEHWTGREWHQVALPASLAVHFGGDRPFGIIGASSSRNVWAFGAAGNTYLRLSGTRWSFGRLPGSKRSDVLVLAVEVFGPRDVWALGTRAIGRVTRLQPYAARFNGTRWRMVAVPGSGSMGSVSAVSGRDMWALVTPYSAGTLRPGRAALLHWNGSAWRAARNQPSLPARGALSAVLAEPSGAVWAGGSAPNSRHGRSELVLRWNGRAWRNLSPPARPTKRDYEITSLAAAGPGAIWAAATTLPAAFRLWHYSAGSWSGPVAPRWYPFWLASVPHSTAVWAAGSSGSLRAAVIGLAGPLPQ
jgi:hypothetical protein